LNGPAIFYHVIPTLGTYLESDLICCGQHDYEGSVMDIAVGLVKDIAVGLVKDIDVDFVLGSGKYEDFKLLDTDEAR